MSIAIVSLILLIPLAILGLIFFAAISGRATRRNEDRPGGAEGDEENDSRL